MKERFTSKNDFTKDQKIKIVCLVVISNIMSAMFFSTTSSVPSSEEASIIEARESHSILEIQGVNHLSPIHKKGDIISLKLPSNKIIPGYLVNIKDDQSQMHRSKRFIIEIHQRYMPLMIQLKQDQLVEIYPQMKLPISSKRKGVNYEINI